MHVLVTAASRHGSTLQIAEAIAEGLRKRGIEATSSPVEEVRTLDGIDAVVVGSAIYEGRWLRSAKAFTRRFDKDLRVIPVWVFSSGMVGPTTGERHDALPSDALAAAAATRAHARREFAGKLDRARLGPIERAMIAATRTKDADDRDWAAIDGFAADIALNLAAIRTVAEVRASDAAQPNRG